MWLRAWIPRHHLLWSCVEYESTWPALLDAVERLRKCTDIPIRDILATSDWKFLKTIFDFCRKNGLTVWLSLSKMSVNQPTLLATAILHPILFPLVCPCVTCCTSLVYLWWMNVCMNVKMNECNVYGWVIGIDGRQMIFAWTMFLQGFTR